MPLLALQQRRASAAVSAAVVVDTPLLIAAILAPDTDTITYFSVKSLVLSKLELRCMRCTACQRCRRRRAAYKAASLMRRSLLRLMKFRESACQSAIIGT